MTLRSYRDLGVWQKSMDLVAACYQMTKGFPKSEIYGLTGQLKRAAIPIPANIAEGRHRQHGKEFLLHLSIAYGSLAELETHIQIAERLNHGKKDKADNLFDQAAEIGRMLNGLRKSLEKKI